MHLWPRLAFVLIALGAMSQPSGAHAQGSAPQFNATDRPDEAAGRAALQGIISGPKASTLEISEFKKTDGLAGEFGGVRRYNMEFSAVVVLNETISISFGGAIIGSANKIVALPPVSDPMSALMTQSGRASKGDRLILTGKIDFMRYESGWRPTEVSFDRRVDSTGRPSASGPVSTGGAEASAPKASVVTAASDPTLGAQQYPASFPVVHTHRAGRCSGELVVSKESVRYIAAGDGKDSFEVPVSQVEGARAWSESQFELALKDGRKLRFAHGTMRARPGPGFSIADLVELRPFGDVLVAIRGAIQ